MAFVLGLCNPEEIKALEDDRGNYLGYVRVVGRRTQLKLDDPVVSLPAAYAKKPLLRS